MKTSQKELWEQFSSSLLKGPQYAFAMVRTIGLQVLQEELLEARERLAAKQKELEFYQEAGFSAHSSEIVQQQKLVKSAQDNVFNKQKEYKRLSDSSHAWVNDELLLGVLSRFGIDTTVRVSSGGEKAVEYVAESRAPIVFAEATLVNSGSAFSKADSGNHWQPITSKGLLHVPSDGACGIHSVVEILKDNLSKATQIFELKSPISTSTAQIANSLSHASSAQAHVEPESLLDRDKKIEQTYLTVSELLESMSDLELDALLTWAVEQEAFYRANKAHNSDYLATNHARISQEKEMLDGYVDREDLIHVLSKAAAHMPELVTDWQKHNAVNQQQSSCRQKCVGDTPAAQTFPRPVFA